MSISDLVFILKWWALLFSIGVIFLPSASYLFSTFFDKGYIFSKILAIAIISYVALALGIIHIAPFVKLTLFAITIVFILFNIALILFITCPVRKGKGLKSYFLMTLKEKWMVYAFEELIFFLTLFFWSFVRAHQPDIHGLEKYMDFGFVNSILRSRYFPPADMWFTPYPINYYYFGHLATAVLTKLSGIPSNITFNLMIASIFAFTFAASFSIGANLIYLLKSQTQNHKSQINSKSKNVKNSKLLDFGNWDLFGAWNFKFRILLGGFLTAFLVSLAGNLHTIYTFFTPYANENPVPPWQLLFSPSTFPNSYWYPNATRFIYHTIHEFPSYSFVVSDLHGHVLDIPFVLLTIALLLSLIFKSQITNHKSQTNSKNQNFKLLSFGNWDLFGTWNLKFEILLLGFFLAVMYMTNAWDGLIYLLAAFIVLVYITFRGQSQGKAKDNLFGTQNLKIKIYNLLGYLGFIAIGFFVFSLPFNLNFKPFVSGIGVLCAPGFLTEIGKIGPFLFEPNHCQRSPLWQLLILYGFFYFWVLSFLAMIYQNLKRSKNSKFLAGADIFILILIFLSTLLILIPEFIYVKDIYPTYYRANTMFKLVYQSFIMLSISSGYIIIRFVNLKSPFTSRQPYFRLAVLIVGSFGLFLVAIYPYFSINSYYGNFKTYYGLDGTTYLRTLYPTDYRAILWLNKNVKGQPVILEAQGDSYTDFARVSANTGLKTILGWTVHEWLWRGSYNIPAPRISQVELLYESPDVNLTRQLIKEYDIKFVFIGDLERQKYLSLDEAKFQKLGNLVFQDGKTKIYKISHLGF